MGLEGPCIEGRALRGLLASVAGPTGIVSGLPGSLLDATAVGTDKVRPTPACLRARVSCTIDVGAAALLLAHTATGA
jgi:hypothetical protein